MKLQFRPCTVRLRRKCVKRSTLRDACVFFTAFFLLLLCGLSFGLALLLAIVAVALICVLIART